MRCIRYKHMDALRRAAHDLRTLHMSKLTKLLHALHALLSHDPQEHSGSKATAAHRRDSRVEALNVQQAVSGPRLRHRRVDHLHARGT